MHTTAQRGTMIDGDTELIVHLGFPTHSFKAPLIYNPYFESVGVNAVVVPMGCRPASFEATLRSVFALSNIRGALITMPHKVSVMGLLDSVSRTARVAGACNAVKRLPDGRLVGDMFDGEGFVRGLLRKGVGLHGASALVVGCGGVGSAIAASLAGAGVRQLALFDIDPAPARALAQRLCEAFPGLRVETGSNDPAGFDLLVNATPLGMGPADPLPVDVQRLAAHTFVAEVVMRTEMTAFLLAAQARGCRIQVGADMLFEMVPAYLEFFGFPSATPEQLRHVSRLYDHDAAAALACAG
jgi:shikimate dehydrogenase